MKKTLLLFAAFSSLITSYAQITVNNADMPSVNDTVRYSTSSSTVSATLLNQTGTNQTWDFSFLVPTAQDIRSFKSAASINLAYILSFSGSSYGTLDANQTIGIIQATDVYNFYKNSNTQFTQDGRGLTVSSIPAAQTYTNKDIQYRFPMNYGNTDSCLYSSSDVNLVLATIASSGKRVNTVDGWGSVTTPFGTFNCLRLKSVVRHTDTLKTQFGNIPVTRNFTEYKWIAKGQKIPVLQIVVTTGLTGTTTISYRDSYRPALFANKARFIANKTKAAKTDTISFTDQSNTIPADPTGWQWTITPGTFQYTAGTNASSQNPRVLFTDTGMYTVKLRAIYAAGSDDTLRTNYIQIGLPPKANFAADKLLNVPLIAINFYDSSMNSPVSWAWAFTPNTISYVGGTSATSKNPKVVFNDTGWYKVRLVATNVFGKDTSTKNAYIHIVDQLGNPPIASFHADMLTPTNSQVVTFTDSSTQTPTTWLWSFMPNTVNFVGTTATSQNPKVVFSSAGFYTVTLKASNLFGFDEEIKTNYIHVIGVGIDNPEGKTALQVYPNPASHNIYISQNTNHAAWASIIDITGKEVAKIKLSETLTHCDISGLPVGIYLIKTSDSHTRLLITR